MRGKIESDANKGKALGGVEPLRVLLIDHHDVVRIGFAQILPALLNGEADQLTLIEADSLSMARAMLAGQDGVEGLDLVLLDADLPDAGDCALPAQLRAEWPAVPIVVISATEDWRRAAEFLHAGMQAFLPTTSRAEVIVNALRLVMSGGRYFPAQVFEVLCAQGLMQPLSSLEEESGGVAVLEQSNFDADVPGLSPRQREVLALMIAGRSNKEIAREMNVSVGTVKNYVAIILRIFNTSSRSKAVFAATAAMRGSTAEAA